MHERQEYYPARAVTRPGGWFNWVVPGRLWVPGICAVPVHLINWRAVFDRAPVATAQGMNKREVGIPWAE